MEEGKEKEEENEKKFGFDLYPNRRSGKSEPTWRDRLFRESSDSEYCKSVCEKNVSHAFEKNPLIRLLRGALKKAGCPIELKRHIVCEDCDTTVQGGYDAEYNQIVICKNVSKARETPEVVLFHELIHMYDYCSNNLDFKNLEHLACTEIRAANLAHCSFLSSWLVGQSSLFDFKKTHQHKECTCHWPSKTVLAQCCFTAGIELEDPSSLLQDQWQNMLKYNSPKQYCVKMRAAYSLVVARNLDFKTALNYVLKVFDRCYNDLEPVGRRLRRKSYDPAMAYEEAKCYNISE